MMNKIINVVTLLLSSLFSATTFAHTGHGNNVFHSHSGSERSFSYINYRITDWLCHLLRL